MLKWFYLTFVNQKFPNFGKIIIGIPIGNYPTKVFFEVNSYEESHKGQTKPLSSSNITILNPSLAQFGQSVKTLIFFTKNILPVGDLCV